MEITITAVSSSMVITALKAGISGNVTVILVSVLVLCVVTAGYFLLRRRK